MTRCLLFAASLLTLSGCYSARYLAAWEGRADGLSNLEITTLGGQQVWADVAWRDGWRVQCNSLTGHHRLLDGRDVRRAWGTEAACRRELMSRAEPERPGTHLVVLLHGLGRTRRAMLGLESSLEADGWRVARLSYPSTRGSIADHAKTVSEALDGLEGVSQVSFVTHSLGGLVARQVLLDDGAPWQQRLEPRALIQIAPPNQGSELARRLDVPLVRWVLGPSFAAMATEEILSLHVPDLPSVVIAGSGYSNPLLAGESDLVVGVNETSLPGSRRWVLEDAAHTFISKDPRTLEVVSRCLNEVRREGQPEAATPRAWGDRMSLWASSFSDPDQPDPFVAE